MNRERLSSNNTEAEKPAWKVEREKDLARKKNTAKKVLLAFGAAVIATAISHSAKTSEIMNDRERAKNVTKIEAEGIVFYDEVNAREEPFVDNMEPNQLADVDTKGECIEIDYNGIAYYYENENDPNGGWYGFDVTQLSNELLKKNYISKSEAKNLKKDKEKGDGIAWFVKKLVGVKRANKTDHAA